MEYFAFMQTATKLFESLLIDQESRSRIVSVLKIIKG